MKALATAASVLLSSTAGAAEPSAMPVDPFSGEMLLRVFGSLAFIVVAIFVLLWLLRRSGTLVRGRAGKMQVVDVLSLGQRERLVLVSIGDQQLLLGVAPGRVQAVHTIDSPYTDSPRPSSAIKFADVLRRAGGGDIAQSSEARADE